MVAGVLDWHASGIESRVFLFGENREMVQTKMVAMGNHAERWCVRKRWFNAFYFSPTATRTTALIRLVKHPKIDGAFANDGSTCLTFPPLPD